MTIKKYLCLGLILAVAMMVTACGTKVVRGATPIVRMNELSHDGSNISLLLSMRNLNGVDLEIQKIDFSVSVEDDTLFSYNGPVDTNIVANGTETWTVAIEESETSRILLDGLESGDIKSLPYSLKGSISSAEDGNLRFEYEGHIYPVPGRPGHFR